MTRFEPQNRTKKFHVDVLKLSSQFPRNAAGFETAKQLIRSAGSVGANYRAACRGKSKADFIYKIEIVLEEADESHYWLEVSQEAGLLAPSEIEFLDKRSKRIGKHFQRCGHNGKKKKR